MCAHVGVRVQARCMSGREEHALGPGLYAGIPDIDVAVRRARDVDILKPDCVVMTTASKVAAAGG